MSVYRDHCIFLSVGTNSIQDYGTQFFLAFSQSMPGINFHWFN